MDFWWADDSIGNERLRDSQQIACQPVKNKATRREKKHDTEHYWHEHHDLLLHRILAWSGGHSLLHEHGNTHCDWCDYKNLVCPAWEVG